MPLPTAERLADLSRLLGLDRHPLDWRLPPIETYPTIVAYAQTPIGKLILFSAFAAFMKPLAGGLWLVMTVLAALVSLAGPYRFHAALLATAMLLAADPYWFGSGGLDQAILLSEGYLDRLDNRVLRAVTLILCVPLAALALYLAHRFRQTPLGRHPILAQHMLCLVLLGVASSQVIGGLPQVLLWSVTITFMAYFWYLAYALVNQNQSRPVPFLSHFATFHPFFAPTTPVPMGLGAANWRRVAPSTDEDLAVTQLKGLKLLVWAFGLKVLQWVYHRFFYDLLGVTPLFVAFESFLDAGHVPGAFALASIIVNFPDQLLTMAIWGHVIIATARLAGFRLLRNTYRPLSSRTIAEFWNRYFFYFKELMVQIYFYPTYLSCFKKYPRLRIAFATFMAAGVGNFFFHLILKPQRIFELGLLEALIQMQTYAFYCTALVTGIVASQLVNRRLDPRAPWWRRQLLPSLGVAVFYGLLSVFDGPQRHVDVAQHFDFLFYVLGVDRWIVLSG